jgi:glycosyltransferase involved in cell wall biosynthesis
MRAEECAMTSVSVVIPCYNYGHFLENAVTSVLDDQKGVDVRVLIIDDASPDNSADIAGKIAARDPRVEVVVHPANKGHIATYNEGLLEWADGDYSVMLSADDWLTRGAPRRATKFLDAHPDVGFVYGQSLWTEDGAPPATARTRGRGWSVWPGPWWLERRFRQTYNCVPAAVVVRTSLQKQVGGYDGRLTHSRDMEMWMRPAANADVGHLRGVDQAYYRLHGHMYTSYTALTDLRQRRLAFEAVLDRYGERLPEARHLSGLMYRKLSRQALWAAARAYNGRRTQQAQVDELVAFALNCWPEASRLPVYRALKSYQRIGPRMMPNLQLFVLSVLFDKAGRWLRSRSWKWRGY